MLDKINKLKPLQIAVAFVVIGLLVFFSGLNGGFQNDDSYQIVNNEPVHSIANLPTFFRSSTFFNGEKLTGVYYRPLMTTTFSIIYSLFGANPFAYHFVQLGIFIASAFILFLVFKHFFKQPTALVLSLIFLVHPLNSQIVYSIPTMQDALFFFFGIFAIWILISYKSTRSLWLAIACLILSLFSKESGILFSITSLLYLYLLDRKRMLLFLKAIALPIVIYLLLKINAVGLMGTQHGAPINELDFIGRMFTAPSVALFYLVKFVFPMQLSLGYYWVYPSFSFEHVFVPLIIDLLALGLFVYLGIRIYKKLTRKIFLAYLFFATWTVLGIGLYMQVIPGLDFTACETWFYFPMAGLLGMIGTALLLVKKPATKKLIMAPALALAIAVIVIFGIRSNMRGYDYKNQYTLATVDISVSRYNPGALNNVSQHLIDQSKYKEAIKYARDSIDVYPMVSSYINLGVALQQTGKFPEAIEAYNKALKYGNLSIIYENLALIHIVYSKPADTGKFFKTAFRESPHNFRLWVYYAVFNGALGKDAEAKNAILKAAEYGQVPKDLYDNFMYGKSFIIPILGKNILIK